MILLEVPNLVVSDMLRQRMHSMAAKNGGGECKAVDVTVADFDGVLLHMGNPDPEVKTSIIVSIKLDFFHQLAEHGVVDYLKGVYGDLMQDEAESGYDVSLLLDLTKLSGPDDAIITQAASLKRYCIGGVFDKYFKIQASGGAGVDGEPAIINYRPQETMFISAHRDRVTVVFSTLFNDDDDVVLGKLFLQEFSEARKKNQAAPQVIFKHKSPPDELSSMQGAMTGDNVGYVTFVLFPRHIDAKYATRTIDLIHSFRTYLHYHLKCSKAYLHSRMRFTATQLLKVLNRAKPEAENKQKKTASGKSFIRR